jgi:hypothetical protein
MLCQPVSLRTLAAAGWPCQHNPHTGFTLAVSLIFIKKHSQQWLRGSASAIKDFS